MVNGKINITGRRKRNRRFVPQLEQDLPISTKLIRRGDAARLQRSLTDALIRATSD